jgi:hypothetical protein
MSKQYDEYLTQHKANVRQGFNFFRENLPELIENDPTNVYSDYEWGIGFNHDQSKSEQDEYAAYDAYFYGGNKSFKVVQDFNKAWLLHIHRNPHHWQYWVLINDDPKEGEILIEMPYHYILEMICDWWAFSWGKDNLEEIFTWYVKRKEYIKLNPKTRIMVESILGKLNRKLKGE